jgi:hypothetical protein
LIDQDYQLLQAVLFQLQLVLVALEGHHQQKMPALKSQVVKAAIPYLVL